MAEQKGPPETDRTANERGLTQQETTGSGSISISGDVIASIAGLAAAEVEGITTPRGGQFHKGEAAKRQVEIVIEGNEVRVAAEIGLVYGYRVKTVAQELQERIKASVERMTGLEVSSVDVAVTRLLFPEDSESAAES